MSAGLAPAPGPQSAPAPSIVELTLGADRVCLAECQWAGPDATAIVLLHDEGDDLDSMRPLAFALAELGFSIVNLDLPGHGLSSGDYADDAPLAIAAAAAFADPETSRGVGFVAVGASCSHLVHAPLVDSVGMVMIDPRELPTELTAESIWRRLPSLYIVDPSDTAADAATEALSAQVRAWNVRCFVHREPAASIDAPLADVSAPDAAHMRFLHIRALSTKFLMEQRHYRTTRTEKPRTEELKDRA